MRSVSVAAQVKPWQKIAARLLNYLARIRVTIAPNFYIRGEQFFHEMVIERMQGHPGYAAFSAMLRSYIPIGVKTLDLGCNKGLETKIIAKTNPVLGIDAYENFVQAARERGVEARVMDFHQLEFSEEFDCVYSNNSLEHAQYPPKVVHGVYRALKPGGIFIVGMPLDGNNPSTKDPAHFFRATEKEVISLLTSNGFRIMHKATIDTEKRWAWAIPPANNQMFICVARKK